MVTATKTETVRTKAASEELERRFRGYPFFEFAHEWGEEQLVPICSEKEFIFTVGGNSAGKTALGSWMTASRLIGFCPNTGEDFRSEANRDYRIKPYCVYVVGTTNDDIVQRLKPSLKQWIPPSEYRVDGETGDWIGKDGTWIVMWKSVTQGARAFQGDEVDWAWVDEHPERKEVWNEILARIGRRLGTVLVTMTAWQSVYWLYTFMYHPDEYPQDHKLIQRIPLDKNPYWNQCDCGFTPRWHPMGEDGERGPCNMPGSVCPGYSPKRGQEKLRRYRRKWRGINYEIRFEGHYRLRAGMNVLSTDTIEAHLKGAEKAVLLHGFFNTKTQFVPTDDSEDPRSIIRISKKPVEGRDYIVGFDSGGGNPTGDYHAAVVVDSVTGDVAAVLHDRSNLPRDIAWPLVQLCRFYNDAFLVPEINRHGGTVVDRVVDLGYGHVYQRRVQDAIGAGLTSKIGFLTDKRTKQWAVDLMVSMMDKHWTCYDPSILHELYGFLYLKENREGKFNIGNGDPDGHDDLCMALCMASVGYKVMGLLNEGGVAGKLPPKPPREHSFAELVEQAHAEGNAMGPKFDEENIQEEREAVPMSPFAMELFMQQFDGSPDDLDWGEGDD